MNKEEILEIFFKERQPNSTILKNCQLYDAYLTADILEPANFEQPKSDSNKIFERRSDKKSDKISDNKSMSNSLSIYSAFSRVSVDQTLYNDIITNRKKHNLFLQLEEDDTTVRKWYYLDETQTIHGPFNTIQMNDFFIFNKLTVNFKVKESYKNDDFIPIKYLIKRYSKKLIAETEEGNRRKPELKNRTKNFKKGNLLKGPVKFKENFKNQGRVERGFSDAPHFSHNYFLDELVEDKEIAEILNARKERASTNST